MSKGYNGWTNYETWNVALWIGNDEGLYEMARELCNNFPGVDEYAEESKRPYGLFVAYLRESAEECPTGNTIGTETPDGVAWNDSGINRDEMDEMLRELAA